MTKKKPIVVTLLPESYHAFIKGSEGSMMFRQWYCTVDGKRTEAMRNGELSCALYVTSILKIFDLIAQPEITVHRAIRAMKRRAWKPIARPRKGAVIVWGEEQRNGEVHKHIGFYIGGGMAISNHSKRRAPAIHPFAYRPVTEILWNEKLG